MRPFMVVIVNELIEASLLPIECRVRRSRGLRFERSMHSLVSAILFGMTGNDAFDSDPQTDPRQREPGKPRQAWRSKRTAVVRENRSGQAVRSEYAFEGASRVALFGRTERVARQNEARDMIDDGQRVAVTVVAETKLPLVVDGHQIVWRDRSRRACPQGMSRRVPATT